jgi:hypothetical protein
MRRVMPEMRGFRKDLGIVNTPLMAGFFRVFDALATIFILIVQIFEKRNEVLHVSVVEENYFNEQYVCLASKGYGKPGCGQVQRGR